MEMLRLYIFCRSCSSPLIPKHRLRGISPDQLLKEGCLRHLRKEQREEKYRHRVFNKKDDLLLSRQGISGVAG